ncbi:hypothetical protein EDO6_02351 [Paenibacillus xylanexedens]|nr:recombinase family protein [Paenibacillus xylanexedens]RPK31724.1 hypothetical protein EDO6_02351 [Paenibacillus xylanexedens]
MIVLRDHQKLNVTQISALIGKIRAIVYTRVSSDIQVDNYSLDTQIDICVNEAKEKFDINRDEIIVLREEAESGDNPNRPMLNYIFFLLGKGLGSKVIFLHPNRLSRHLHLQQDVTHKIWELGCDLHFVEFDLQKGNAESMLNYNIQGSISQYNKAKILADTKRGRNAMVANNKIPGMNRIYGYTYDKELDTLVENPIEKERYLLMVKMILEGSSCSEIARVLSSKRFAAPKGGDWYQVTISRILRNPAYKGTFYYGKTETIQVLGKKKKVSKPKEEWTMISVPEYIDEVTFEKVQKVLDDNVKFHKNKGKPTQDYLLRNLVRCGRCGASVSSGTTTKTKYGLLKYYTCTRKTTKSYNVESGKPNVSCRGANWRVDMIDNLVWGEFTTIVNNPQHLVDKLLERVSDTAKVDELHKSKDILVKSLKEKERLKERYIDLYAEGIIKSKEELSLKIAPIEIEISDLNKELSAISENLKMSQHQDDSALLAANILEKFKKIIQTNLTIEDKRRLIYNFIDSVVLHDDKRIEIVYKISPHKELPDNESLVKLQGSLDSRQVHGR